VLLGEVPDLTGDALAGFFDDLVAESNAQLNELASLEQINLDQFAELNLLRRIAEEQLNIFRAFEPGGKFGQFAGPAPGPGVNSTPDFSAPAIQGAVIDQNTELRELKADMRRLIQITTAGNQDRVLGNADRRAGFGVTVDTIEEGNSIRRDQLREQRNRTVEPGRTIRRPSLR